MSASREDIVFRRLLISACLVLVIATPVCAGTGVHTTYLWHMHQPIYWPDASVWNPDRYETVYETITLGHSQNDEYTIFDKDDRVGDYQHYPQDAVSSISDLAEAGAQVSFAGALMENIFSLGDAGWNGGRYASDWYSHYRTARGWPNSAGQPRLEPVLVGFHHAIGPLLDENALHMELALAKQIYGDAWGPGAISQGFFPAEMCFSERMIPALVEAGVTWTIVPDLHIARACADYPYTANLDNCDPPNPADQTNPAQGTYTNHTISRGVTLKVPYPYGFTPHRAEYVDPDGGGVASLVVVPAANAMGWEEGYGLFGTGGIDAIASANNPAQPMLVLFAHDGDNAWSGGNSYYYENVTQFSHAAAGQGYTPTTIATYLQHHPVPMGNVVHVEDGGWVNADGDFGSPQYINWNWPLVNASGDFDIPAGWAEDERNWAVLTAAQNRVETAAAIAGVDTAQVLDPGAGANAAERAWHFLLAGYESGYMYYGASLDMEIKATLACNEAVALADPVVAGGSDTTAPTIWIPQRLPWNPGGHGGGALWGYPGGAGEPMSSDFHVWTFAHDVSGLARVELMVREDADGTNDPATHVNELYAGGAGVGAWAALPMNNRVMPVDEPWPLGEIDFTELPAYIADQYWLELTGYEDVLLDYYIEAEDNLGFVKRSPIQHVWVGAGGTSAPDSVAWTDPAEPTAGESVTVWYDPTGRPLDGAPAIWIHRGHSDWQGVVDEAMSYNATEDAWWLTFTVSAAATQLDFVFHDNAGTWDNNGGADWHVPVSGGGPVECPFVMDGTLDGDVWEMEDCGDHTLWAKELDGWLYLATDIHPTNPGTDVFLLLHSGSIDILSPPWAKSGATVGFDAFLAREGDSGWRGWFDADETTPPAGDFRHADGTVLEGVLWIDDLYPGGWPTELNVAATAFGTTDGAVLLDQCPGGDGDGDLTSAADWTPVWVPVAVDETPVLQMRLAAHPNPFNPGTRLAFSLPEAAHASLDIFDARGRRVRRLLDEPRTAGVFTINWDGRDDAGHTLPGGVYLARMNTASGQATIKLSLIK